MNVDQFIKDFFVEVSNKNISFCHWKSNNNLSQALNGIDDIDILVKQADHHKLGHALTAFNFIQHKEAFNHETPFVYHYYALDPISGAIVHLHVYFRIITGGSIFKNYWIKAENLLLTDTQQQGYMPISNAEADFLVFVIRKFLEQPSLVEHYLFLKDYNNVIHELKWLTQKINEDTLYSLLALHFPQIPQQLFTQCWTALTQKHKIIKRVILGIKMRRHFTNRVTSEIHASLSRTQEFLGVYLRHKFNIKKKSRFLFPGGKLIAFTGSEASGKSTLSKAIASWLNRHFNVCHVHVGKPPKCWRTQPFWLLVRLGVFLKRFLKTISTSSPSSASTTKDVIAINRPHPIVAVLDAIDRAHLLKQCYRKMLTGAFIITDRYTSPDINAIDGPRIQPSDNIFYTWLAKIEQGIYRKQIGPDIIIKASVPLETALQRNALREQPEPEDFVRYRYELAKNLFIGNRNLNIIDTTNSLDSCLNQVKKIIWEL